MLLLEFFYTFALGLFVYVYWESKGMGLHEEIPRDGPGRARYFSHRILSVLKQELHHVNPLHVSPDQITFQRPGNSTCRLLCQQGQLLLQVGEGDLRTLHSLGRQGYAEFKVGERSLQIDVCCTIDPLHPYSFTVRLPLGKRSGTEVKGGPA